MGDHSYSTVGRIEQLEQMVEDLQTKLDESKWECKILRDRLAQMYGFESHHQLESELKMETENA